MSTRYPADWRSEAACRDVPVDVFTPWDPDARPLGQDPDLADRAKAICATCPVTAECLADAAGDRYTVRAGLTPAERLRAAPVAEGSGCGTTAGYQKHQRAGEQPCPECRSAKARYDRGWRATVAEPRQVAACGTEAGYRRHRRHDEEACRPCKDANAAAVRRRTARAS